MSALTDLIAHLEADEHWEIWTRTPIPMINVGEGTCDSCCETKTLVADYESPDGKSGWTACEDCDQMTVDHDRVLPVLKEVARLIEVIEQGSRTSRSPSGQAQTWLDLGYQVGAVLKAAGG